MIPVWDAHFSLLFIKMASFMAQMQFYPTHKAFPNLFVLIILSFALYISSSYHHYNTFWLNLFHLVLYLRFFFNVRVSSLTSSTLCTPWWQRPILIYLFILSSILNIINLSLSVVVEEKESERGNQLLFKEMCSFWTFLVGVSRTFTRQKLIFFWRVRKKK